MGRERVKEREKGRAGERWGPRRERWMERGRKEERSHFKPDMRKTGEVRIKESEEEPGARRRARSG